MYKRCVSEQSARRQRELEAGLLEAMLTCPYEDISVSDLCADMNIPRKSFYRYFTSKEGALYALIDHTMLEFSGEVFSSDFRATLTTLEHFFSFWKSKKSFLDAITRNGLSGILIQRALEYARTDELVSANLAPLQPNQPREYVILFFIAGLLTMVIQWHDDYYKTSVKEMASVAAQMLTHPLVTISGNSD